MSKIYVYRRFERFWHWTQALFIFLLMLSGFEIHGSIHFFGSKKDAIMYHKMSAISLFILIALGIFWQLITGEWKQYIPTMQNLRARANYYLFGIFRNAPHPTRKTELSTLNPFQKIVNFGFKLLIIPVMVVSGMLLYVFYRYPKQYESLPFGSVSVDYFAFLHTTGAYLLVSLLIAHIYLITTGRTPTSNLKAMITGYETVDDPPREETPMKENKEELVQ